VVEGGGYHYYPPEQQVRGWLDTAGFTVADEAAADSYWHLLLAGPAQRIPAQRSASG
jgi:hypothetical protein